MKRFSKKRQSILECLRSTDTHPTADWVFRQLKPVHPSLSLGTVYRNLASLKAEGQIRSVGFVNGEERFDGTVAPHTHLVCRNCGRVLDVWEIPVPEDLSARVQALSGYEALASDLQFSGICPDCAKKRGKSQEKNHHCVEK